MLGCMIKRAADHANRDIHLYCLLCQMYNNNKMSADNQFADIDYVNSNKHNRQKLRLKKAHSVLQSTKSESILPKIASMPWRRHSRIYSAVHQQPTHPSNSPIQNSDCHLKAAKFMERYSQLNSQPITPSTSHSRLTASPLHPIIEYPFQSNHKVKKTQEVKLDQEKDKCLPRHSVLCKSLGFSEEKLKSMTQAEVKQAEAQYIKHKGKQYLRQNKEKQRCIRINHCKTQSEDNLSQRIKTPQKDKGYVRQIFKEVAEAAQAKLQAKLQIQKKKSVKQRQERMLVELEQALGKKVYKKVAKHLHTVAEHKLTYVQQLEGERKVDEALINFIRFKINRITTLPH